jgi:hypothetical protein
LARDIETPRDLVVNVPLGFYLTAINLVPVVYQTIVVLRRATPATKWAANTLE